jgi:anti-anti-sigma regulatory factor
MANVTFLCAAGLRALIQARDMIIAAGGCLVLRAPSRPTRRVLAITRTEYLFPHAVDSAK